MSNVPIWGQGRPEHLHRNVIVCIDADNILIRHGKPLIPDDTIFSALQRILIASRTIAYETALFLFIDRVKRYPGYDINVISQVCQSLDIQLVHCERDQYGCDTVDNRIISFLKLMQSTSLSDVVFALASEDDDFTPIIKKIRSQNREFYLLLPTSQHPPRHRKLVSGWTWPDPDASFNRSMFFLLQEGDPEETNAFICNFARSYQHFDSLYKEVLSSVQAMENRIRNFNTKNEIISFIISSIKQPGKLLSKQKTEVLLKYFIAYNVLYQDTDKSWCINRQHRVITSLARV